MTSFAFILGCVPLWIATGSGAASRRILGTVVISGMLAATLLAIFLIPMLFVVVEKLATWRSRSRKAAMTPAPGSEHVMRFASRDCFDSGVRSALSAGCLVGPNYSKPELPTPDAIRGAEGAAAGPAFGEAKWWEVFQDEQLQTLVRTALDQNDDVRLAAARVLEAEAQLGITRADQYPSVSADVQAGGGRTPRAGIDGSAQCGSPPIEGSTAWELDFWGRFRRATESARAQLLATNGGGARC